MGRLAALSRFTLSVATALACARPALAAESVPSTLAIKLSDCVPPVLIRQRAYDAIFLELRLAGVRPALSGKAPPEGSLVIEMQCDTRDRARLSLTRNDNQAKTEEIVELGDVAESDLSRALALSAAEFVRADWKELATPTKPAEPAEPTQPAEPAEPSKSSSAAFEDTPAPAAAGAATSSSTAAPPPPPPPALVPKPAAPPAPRDHAEQAHEDDRERVHLTALGIARAFPHYDTFALGGGALVSWRSLDAGAELVASRHHDDLGDATLGSGALVLDLRLWEQRFGDTTLAVGPGGALGVSFASANPLRPAVRTATDVGLYADARLFFVSRFDLGGVELVARLDGGYANGSVEYAGDRLLGGHASYFAGGALGLAF